MSYQGENRLSPVGLPEDRTLGPGQIIGSVGKTLSDFDAHHFPPASSFVSSHRPYDQVPRHQFPCPLVLLAARKLLVSLVYMVDCGGTGSELATKEPLEGIFTPEKAINQRRTQRSFCLQRTPTSRGVPHEGRLPSSNCHWSLLDTAVQFTASLNAASNNKPSTESPILDPWSSITLSPMPMPMRPQFNEGRSWRGDWSAPASRSWVM